MRSALPVRELRFPRFFFAAYAGAIAYPGQHLGWVLVTKSSVTRRVWKIFVMAQVAPNDVNGGRSRTIRRFWTTLSTSEMQNGYRSTLSIFEEQEIFSLCGFL